MRSTTLPPDDSNHDKVLTILATEASSLELDDVGTTIYLVKPGMSEKETIKRLKKANAKPLSRTFAFLMNLKEDDEEVTKFTMAGCAEMIFYRLQQLMPSCCKFCNKTQTNKRDEKPQVTCKLCGIGACKDCFSPEERTSKWAFLCGGCDKQITGMMGAEALDKSHFRVIKKKKQDKTDGNDEKGDEIEEDEEDGEIDEEKEEEVIEVPDDDFKEVKKRGFLAKKKKEEVAKKTNPDDLENKAAICHHFKKNRCHHGISGKQPYNGKAKCPYRHPMICQRLLRHGDRAKGGCRGREDGCTDFHQVKMCFSSMNTKKCDQQKDCKNGYHIKGTVTNTKPSVTKKSVNENEKVDISPKEAVKPNAQIHGENNSNVSSFLGQLFLQQQEMMAEQQQQRKEQAQLQQQMMQLMTRLGGAMEGRMTPIMGMPNPIESMQRNQTLGFRPVG